MFVTLLPPLTPPLHWDNDCPPPFVVLALVTVPATDATTGELLSPSLAVGDTDDDPCRM